MQEWLGMTAADLGRGIAAGQIDPVSLCETFLEAIDAHRCATVSMPASQPRAPVPRPPQPLRAQGRVSGCRCWTGCRSVGKICLTRRASQPKRGLSC